LLPNTKKSKMKNYYNSFLGGLIITNSRPSKIDPSRKIEVLINFMGRIIEVVFFDKKHPEYEQMNSFGLCWGFNLGPVGVDYFRGNQKLMKGRFERFKRRLRK